MGDLSRLYQPTVLVVDDDADVLDTTAHGLLSRGFRVLTATGKQGALDVCREQEGQVDALIADLSLPGDVPGELAKAVTSAYRNVKVVYATGIPRHVALAQGLVRPDAPYLEKPVAPDVLASLLRSLLQHRIAY